MIDLEFDRRWFNFLKERSEEFGDELDLQSILFLIGIQELGFGFRKYSKDDKLNIVHIAVCTLLESYGYYAFKERDEKGWPVFEFLKELPALNEKDQERLMKDAVMEYFIEE
ncbi:MAG: hypothetical protein HKN39_00865 [Flavobacteriales bacterium]|nr:hypothetical protein [Flavobacteriales bacterium]